MNQAIELFYVFFQGIVIFQALVFLVIFFLTLKKDTLYYALFLLAIATYFFINAPFTFFGIPEQLVWDAKWYGYINTPVIIVANILYLLFHQAFFADLTPNPIVKKAFRTALIVLLLLIVLFSILSKSSISSQVIYYIAKTVTIVPAAIVVYYLLRETPFFYRWIVAGLICVIIGTSLTAWMDYQFSEGMGESIFATVYPFFFVKLGLLVEMLCYLIARLKKWIYQEKQLAVEKIESQLAVEKIRNKISGELHDDIGSTLSGIAMYSNMMQSMLKAEQYDKVQTSVATIEHSANELVHKLSDLVWAIKPGKDSFEEMIEKLKQYGLVMCAAKGLEFECSYSNIDPATAIGMDRRQHLYLLIKEAINNAVKYSGAQVIKLLLNMTEKQLEVEVQDDGCGFDINDLSNGNGLTNMKERARLMNGYFKVASQQGKGTSIKLLISM